MRKIILYFLLFIALFTGASHNSVMAFSSMISNHIFHDISDEMSDCHDEFDYSYCCYSDQNISLNSFTLKSFIKEKLKFIYLDIDNNPEFYIVYKINWPPDNFYHLYAYNKYSDLVWIIKSNT